MKEGMETQILKICTGSSRWVSANRNMAKHIYLAGRAICGKNYRNGWSDVFDGAIGDVSCNRCKQVYNKK